MQTSGSVLSVKILQFKYSGKPNPNTSKKNPQRRVVSAYNNNILIIIFLENFRYYNV